MVPGLAMLGLVVLAGCAPGPSEFYPAPYAGYAGPARAYAHGPGTADPVPYDAVAYGGPAYGYAPGVAVGAGFGVYGGDRFYRDRLDRARFDRDRFARPPPFPDGRPPPFAGGRLPGGPPPFLGRGPLGAVPSGASPPTHLPVQQPGARPAPHIGGPLPPSGPPPGHGQGRGPRRPGEPG